MQRNELMMGSDIYLCEERVTRSWNHVTRERAEGYEVTCSLTFLSFESTTIQEASTTSIASLVMLKQSKLPLPMIRRDQPIKFPTSTEPQDVSLDYEYAQADGHMDVARNDGAPLLDLKERSVYEL
jgi:hypothetical protein